MFSGAYCFQRAFEMQIPTICKGDPFTVMHLNGFKQNAIKTVVAQTTTRGLGERKDKAAAVCSPDIITGVFNKINKTIMNLQCLRLKLACR